MDSDKMANKFHCGRLVINKDGSVKKLALADGGGTRDCTISHIDMGFEEIHDRLREIFLLDQTNSNSKLYDFQWRELDKNRYTTFYEYVHKNGLKFKGTLLYLCTPTDREDTVNTPSPEKRRPIQSPRPVIRRIPQVEADSSTPAVVIKTDEHRQPMNEPVVNHRISSFSNYSFEKSLNELIDYLRHLIVQYNRETMLIQLFEYICTIHGLSSIILDRLKQQNQIVNEHEKSIYNHGLDKIEKLSRSIKAFIELNKMKISHIDQHSIIMNSFHQFHQNFNILRDRWINNKTNNTQSRSYSSTNSVPTTSFSSSRKRTHESSSHRKSNEEDTNEKYLLFKNLLKSLDHLLDVLQQRRFTSFYYLVESLIGEIKVCRSNIKLFDCRSLYDAEQFIITIERRLTNRINDEHHRASPHGIHEQLRYSFDKILDAIQHLLNSFQHYQSQINKHKRLRSTTHRLSPVEDKTIIHRSTQQKTRIDDDDQSSEASHSSIGDEVLMEVARDAYEQRPNRSK